MASELDTHFPNEKHSPRTHNRQHTAGASSTTQHATGHKHRAVVSDDAVMHSPYRLHEQAPLQQQLQQLQQLQLQPPQTPAEGLLQPMQMMSPIAMHKEGSDASDNVYDENSDVSSYATSISASADALTSSVDGPGAAPRQQQHHHQVLLSKLQQENLTLKAQMENAELRARLAAQLAAAEKAMQAQAQARVQGQEQGESKEDPDLSCAAGSSSGGSKPGDSSSKKQHKHRHKHHGHHADGSDDAPHDATQDAPDAQWCSETTVVLSRGTCAYRLEIPEPDGQSDYIPLVVCLHDLMNCSSMWRDIAHLIAHPQTGPPARVLVFDYYGRGRSLYTAGMKCSLELFVEQLWDLLQATGLLQEIQEGRPCILIGQGLGACVAAGFTAKYSSYVHSMVLLSPLGVAWSGHGLKQGLLKVPIVGDAMWRSQLGLFIERTHRKHSFYDPHNRDYKHVVKRELRMLTWQKHHSQGYFDAIRSTLRHFPLHQGGLVDLYNALGRNPTRQVLVVWGIEDSMCDCEGGMEEMSGCFSQAGQFLAVPEAGRYTLIENFPVVAKEILSFLKTSTAAIRKRLRGCSY